MSISHINLEKKHSTLSIYNIDSYKILNLFAVDPYITEYIPIHFFSNYLYMIDQNFEESGPYLHYNKIYQSHSSNVFRIDSNTTRFLFKEANNMLVGNGIIFHKDILKYCIMISSTYVKKMYDDFFEFLLSKSVAYEKLIRPLLDKDSSQVNLLEFMYVSMSYDFFIDHINHKDLVNNILIYRDQEYNDNYNFIDIISNRFKNHNNNNVIDEDEKLIKSLCFCKIQINPFEDINGPEKELISLL